MTTGKTGSMLGKAISIAAQVHEAQKDMGGNAYILHPLRVMMRLRTDDQELMQIAVLHDSIEDSNGAVTIDSLHKEGFSERVLTALRRLTHNKNDSYEEYIKNITTNKDAVRVKIDDIRDNSDITRLKGLREKDFARMEKYHKAYLFLKSALDAMEKVGY